MGNSVNHVRALPIRAQTAPVFGVRSGDYDGDGFLDLLMARGSLCTVNVSGRSDAPGRVLFWINLPVPILRFFRIPGEGEKVVIRTTSGESRTVSK